MSKIFATEHVSVYLKQKDKNLRVITDISLRIENGKIVGLIGESGCGKSVFWKSVLGLTENQTWEIEGNAEIAGHQIDFRNENELRTIRGKDAAVILQDPMSSFDQIFTVERHFWETAKAHTDWSRAETDRKAEQLLKRLYINDPKSVLRSYPFQCSGGMLQRIMIAIALMMEPALLIADEPTTSVDVTVQLEILTMLKELNQNNLTSILFISHDLKAVESIADEIYVMYAGYIVESFPVMQLSSGQAEHPYTIKLLEARPSFTKGRLKVLRGNPPRLFERQEGCPFYPRCDEACERCKSYDMHEVKLNPQHFVRCILREGNK